MLIKMLKKKVIFELHLNSQLVIGIQLTASWNKTKQKSKCFSKKCNNVQSLQNNTSMSMLQYKVIYDKKFQETINQSSEKG
jgi:hypothetical protein